MSNFFSERGYPDSILSKALNRVQNVNRESALEPSASDNEERIPFTLTFHPNNLAARNVVLRNFKILQSDPETPAIFPNRPLVSFKRDQNLRNSLVRSSLPSNLEPGTFNCSRKVCNTCPSLILKRTFADPADRTKSMTISPAQPPISFTVSLVLSATNSTLENQAVN